MSVKFRLIERKNLGKDAAATPRKYYAQAVNNGYVTFEELCNDIAENCTLTSADVKAVLDRMNYQLDKNLRAGRIVQFGELGNFRMVVGSSGATTEENFSVSQIKKNRISFTPGKRLRVARSQTSYEKDTPQVVEVECNRTHLD
ncbi:putative histone-like DNA-binding protein [Parabacteroides sp. PF5-5]|uniref:HU family DNA-binding protein n=1 Tax=unclassified Parabacteroides TaxID=2649774 RepID=UPI002473C1A1|nr:MULTISPECIES: HU family DNA-binding protein [unclassified Parabacteroides]MDH6304982.1 putative histone-like DNA-binding protein [Parabacteroides sp. PH5-39]MDH6315933.1 putative histone-like DNA-binding protein [Parabacteroides sp. PF5-13]MDH6319590.1 putative histone-like DNA-binding protein [Parabacteroides sp. PH5-13]MDH6323321.1 putative histone-like DNA-binding protein [Parabacteroides sp. PH5-8]MDH6327171.1 putative histone-like DNA-binding protein [Parabacteroides sp. PH5-41]